MRISVPDSIKGMMNSNPDSTSGESDIVLESGQTRKTYINNAVAILQIAFASPAYEIPPSERVVDEPVATHEAQVVGSEPAATSASELAWTPQIAKAYDETDPLAMEEIARENVKAAHIQQPISPERQQLIDRQQ